MKKLLFLAMLINFVFAGQNNANNLYKYTAVAEHGILVSNNSIKWDYIDLSKEIKPFKPNYQVSLKSIAYGNNMFVIVGSYGLVASSNDEILWNSNYITLKEEVIMLKSVVFYQGKFYANSDKFIFSSSDGVKWFLEAQTNYLNKLAIANDKLYAFCSDKLMQFSDLGWITVYEERLAGSFFTSISYGNGAYIVYSNDGASTLISKDGINWINNKAQRGYGPDGRSSIYVDKFIAISYLSKSHSDMHYGSVSSDGLTWAFDTMTVNNAQNDNGLVTFIVHDGSKYIAGGGNNSATIFLSYDGIKWFSVANLPYISSYVYDMAIVNNTKNNE